MKGLVTLGILLLIAWGMGVLVFKVADFLIHVVLIVGALVLLLGLLRRVRGGVSSGR